MRYSKEIKQNVVEKIMKGDLLLEEAMEKYGIDYPRTIIRWLQQYQKTQSLDKRAVAPKKQRKIVRYSASIQIQVVHAILDGELLIEEAMEKYGIGYRRTIVNWLQTYLGK